MKIYNKNCFIFGLVCLCALPLFALEIIKVDWWQWLFTIAISGKYLYIGLSKNESRRQAHIEKNYKSVSHKLLGRYASIKTNLPLVILGVFFAVAIIIRYALDVTIPVGIVVVVLIFTTVAAFYSIGLNRQIAAYIEDEESETAPKTSD